MEFVVGISWPRSGHHMLVRLLQLYFGDAFGYCDFYSGKPSLDDITTCCGKLPCKYMERINLTKNHDFDLEAAQLPGQKYLIQYRDFTPSVVSNFELFLRNGGEDSAASFRKFASAEFSRYLGFTRKWIHSEFGQGQLLINYSTFLQDPAGELARTISYFDPDWKIDDARIARAIAEVDGQKIEQRQVQSLRKSGVHQDRDIRQFRYYKLGLFEDLGNLRLSRQIVIDAFQVYLGRDPAEQNMLTLQGYESRAALEEFLKNSEEYQQRRPNGPPS